MRGFLTTQPGVSPPLLAVAVVLALAATPALARDDARVGASCGRGASGELRLESDDGAIEVEFRVRRGRDGERWSVALVHERRVVYRGRATTHGSGFRIRRSLPDFGGADEVAARATGPRGITCQATAVLSS
jgi:hypothetical protein